MKTSPEIPDQKRCPVTETIRIRKRPRAIHPSIVLAMAIPVALNAQSLAISYDTSQNKIIAEFKTIPYQQFRLRESSDLSGWTYHSFHDHSATLDLGPPNSSSHFFRLKPLYGEISWQAAADMPAARDSFAGGVIDGKLYLFGGNGDPLVVNPDGMNPDGDNLPRLDIYDPNASTGGWTRGPDYDLGLEEVSGAVVGGKLYIFGGHGQEGDLQVNLCYDPAGNTWTDNISEGAEEKPTQGAFAPAIAWGDEILIVGGKQDDMPTAPIEAYHTVFKTWRKVADFPYQRATKYAAAVYKDTLYIIGGLDITTWTAHNRIERFDLYAGIWLDSIENTLPYPIISHRNACPVVNGKMIIGGGVATLNDSWQISDVSTEAFISDVCSIYDIETNSFSQNNPLLEPFDGHVFLLAEDKLFALGGEIGPDPLEDAPTNRMLIGTFEE